jgi:hypothetical protein
MASLFLREQHCAAEYPSALDDLMYFPTDGHTVDGHKDCHTDPVRERRMRAQCPFIIDPNTQLWVSILSLTPSQLVAR